jgi:preprotein translocase subunit SecF
MINIIKNRYIFFGISLLIIIAGFTVLAVYGLPLGIDFTNGTLTEYQFTSGTLPSSADLKTLYSNDGVPDIQTETTGTNSIIIRSTVMDSATQAKVLADLNAKFGTVTVLQSNSVSPIISKEVTNRAILAVIVAAVVIVLYITYVFRKVPNAFRYGICAVIAMIHDILIVFSLTAIGGHFFGWTVDSLFLTALLTVIGFSVQDTIVIYDRVRENNSIHRKISYEQLVNHSIVQTLQRSINTNLVLVEFIMLALVLLGGVTIRQFTIILLVGLFSGAYSSIFVAAPLLVIWETKEWKTWFRRKSPGTI